MPALLSLGLGIGPTPGHAWRPGQRFRAFLESYVESYGLQVEATKIRNKERGNDCLHNAGQARLFGKAPVSIYFSVLAAVRARSACREMHISHRLQELRRFVLLRF